MRSDGVMSGNAQSLRATASVTAAAILSSRVASASAARRDAWLSCVTGVAEARDCGDFVRLTFFVDRPVTGTPEMERAVVARLIVPRGAYQSVLSGLDLAGSETQQLAVAWAATRRRRTLPGLTGFGLPPRPGIPARKGAFRGRGDFVSDDRAGVHGSLVD